LHLHVSGGFFICRCIFLLAKKRFAMFAIVPVDVLVPFQPDCTADPWRFARSTASYLLVMALSCRVSAHCARQITPASHDMLSLEWL
jgi:hypothetical protein